MYLKKKTNFDLSGTWCYAYSFGQKCPESGPQAHHSRRSDFIQPAAFVFSVIIYSPPALCNRMNKSFRFKMQFLLSRHGGSTNFV